MKYIKFILITLSFIICFNVPSYGDEAHDEFRRILKEAWLIGYNAGTYERCELLKQDLMRRAVKAGPTSDRLRIVRILYKMCKVGAKDRIRGRNHLDMILEAVPK